jgi:hypothetical protein
MTVCEPITAAHVCEHRAQKLVATPEARYHYVGSGLPNVYLVGITYYVCPECNKQAAEIPAMKELFTALARAIVSKSSPLTGPELRFLRKDLGKKSIDFAPMVSLTPQHLSLLENTPDPVDPGRDKLVRLVYRALSSDKKLKDVFEKEREFERWITSIQSGAKEEIVAHRLKNHHWKVEAMAAAA